MKSAESLPARNKSLDSSVDLRLDLASVSAVSAAEPAVLEGVEYVAKSLVERETKLLDSSRQLTMPLPSEAPVTENGPSESASGPTTKQGDKAVGTPARRSSGTMRSFLQRVMSSQSDSHIRIAPLSKAAAEAELRARDLSSTASARSVTQSSLSATPLKRPEGNSRDDDDVGGDFDNDANNDANEDDDDDGDLTAKTFGDCDLIVDPIHQRHDDANKEAAGLCEVFLNSSLQLLQVQSDTRQRVRQLWTCAQRLRWESQLSDTGLELLHQELLNVMKAITVEKLEGARHIKSGYLTLVQAPPAVVAANMIQRGAAAATKSLLFGGPRTSLDQRVWVNLSEEHCRLELVPTSNEERLAVPVAPLLPQATAAAATATCSIDSKGNPTAESLPQSNESATIPGIGKFKLPASISWLLSDPMQQLQQKDDESTWIGRTSIKLQGCQVRRMPPVAAMPTPGAPLANLTHTRFQLLVPNPDPSIGSSIASPFLAGVPDQTSASASYGIYVFEIPAADGDRGGSAEQERENWIRAIDRVCVFHLYALENQLRDACYMLQFRDILAASFPVCVPLAWLRNRLEKIPSSMVGMTMSAQQRATYQFQQQQRRSSRNLSMVQIVKDLERDRILVDKKLLISCMGSGQSLPVPSTATTTLSDGSVVVEHDSVAEIVKYLVGKAMAFGRRVAQAKPKQQGATDRAKPPLSACSSFSNESAGSRSPSSRLSKYTEARALAFVERVLRGSSRTQTGGDIYDAISFFCQQRNLTICPMSHDAHPVQLNVVASDDDDDDELFRIEIEVSMQFKVVEMPSMAPGDDVLPNPLALASPRDWAVVEGTLLRQFTLGKLSEPGTVTLAYLPDLDCPSMVAPA